MSEIIDFILDLFHLISPYGRNYSKEVLNARVLTDVESVFFIDKLEQLFLSEPALAKIRYEKILLYRTKRDFVKLMLLDEDNKLVHSYRITQTGKNEWIYAVINK